MYALLVVQKWDRLRRSNADMEAGASSPQCNANAASVRRSSLCERFELMVCRQQRELGFTYFGNFLNRLTQYPDGNHYV